MPEEIVDLAGKKKIPIVGGWMFPDPFSEKGEWIIAARTVDRWILFAEAKRTVTPEDVFAWDGGN